MLIVLGLLGGCGVNKSSPSEGDGEAARLDGGSLARVTGHCVKGAAPPSSLDCSGLYADIVAKTLASGVEPYAPAVALWSDGASKQRWISLPPGQKIDNSNPDEWRFPVGTKVWKEFSDGGKRIETRLWQKVTATFWVNATYAWNGDETAAVRSAGGDIPWGSGTYHIPTDDECLKCHRGRTDRILGFEQALLGLAGATGVTLGRLVAERRLMFPPSSSQLSIGDDGTGVAAPALAWMHVNCGTTCHNRNSDSTAWATGLFLRLDPTQLDGRAVDRFDTLTSTVGVPAVTTAWRGQPRIAPRDPARSLLYQLISRRGEGEQMPPFGSSIVDRADIPLVESWIARLTGAPVQPSPGPTH